MPIARLAAVADPPPAGLRRSTRGAASPRMPGLCDTEVPDAAPRRRRRPPRPRATTPRRSRASPSTRCGPRSTTADAGRGRRRRRRRARGRRRVTDVDAVRRAVRPTDERRCWSPPTSSRTSPSAAACSAAPSATCHAVAGVSLARRAGRDARPGGRVGLRQVHHRPAAPRPHPARRRATVLFDGADAHQARRARS